MTVKTHGSSWCKCRRLNHRMFLLDSEDTLNRVARSQSRNLPKTSAAVFTFARGKGSLGEVVVLFLLQGLQWSSTRLLMTFSQSLMDPLVSNFAHRAHGIMLDQLSLWFVSMCSAYKAIPLYLCVVRQWIPGSSLKLQVIQKNNGFHIVTLLLTQFLRQCAAPDGNCWKNWNCGEAR